MEKHIYLVRHGESESNADGIHRGKEAELTELGRAQAEAVAERIERIGVEAVLSSDFRRAIDTAEAIAKRLGITRKESELFGEWLEPSASMGKHKDTPEAREVKTALYDETAHDHFQHSDEETFPQLVARAKAAIRLLEEHPASTICVVTHGNFLRIMTGTILFKDSFTRPIFVAMCLRLLTRNTGITGLRHTQEFGWQLMHWNDSAHFG
jgi:broad specificity phosphatase PhoE